MKQNDLWWSTPANTAQDSKHKAPFPISTIRRQLCILHFRKGQQTTKVIKILLLQYISTTGTTNDWSTLTRKGTQITATGSDHHNKAQNTTDGRFPSSCKLVFVIFMTSKDNLPPCASLSKPGPQFNYRAMQVICCQTSALDHRLLNIQLDHGVTEWSQSHGQIFVQHQHQVTDYSTNGSWSHTRMTFTESHWQLPWELRVGSQPTDIPLDHKLQHNCVVTETTHHNTSELEHTHMTPHWITSYSPWDTRVGSQPIDTPLNHKLLPMRNQSWFTAH